MCGIEHCEINNLILFSAAKYGSELANYMKTHKVNPLKQMLVPMAQVLLCYNLQLAFVSLLNKETKCFAS